MGDARGSAARPAERPFPRIEYYWGVTNRGWGARGRRPGAPRRDSASTGPVTGERGGGDHTALADELRRLDGGRYGQYRGLTGRWRFPGHVLEVARVQADPYAPPSRLAVVVPAEVAELPEDLWRTPVRARALAGYLVRQVGRLLPEHGFRLDVGGQEVLDRSSCRVEDGRVVLRLGMDLPGRGRVIDGRAAERMLCRELPAAVAEGLRWAALDQGEARAFVDSVEDTDALRRALPELGLVAFVADGAVLPRRSGVDDRPLPGGGVPFASPESLRVEVELPHRGRVTGMGVPEGVSLVVGGGFHGKSTLLRALEKGVYDHVPGDGRELVVSLPDTVKIRAEDGRRVTRVDVSPFVAHLPTGADTTDFSTDNASGSTSQAASIVEAVEAGARVLLVDEDTAATNLMIRDARMQALVAKDREPLTPFVDLVRPLHRQHGVSTVLVVGGSGDYLDVADRVVMMDAYRPVEVTERAREVAATPTGRHVESAGFGSPRRRVPDPDSVEAESGGRVRVRARGRDALTLGETDVDLRAVEQVVDPSQVTGIGLAILRCVRAGHLDGTATLAEVLDRLDADLGADGVSVLAERTLDDFVVPRRHEVAAALNRLRTLRVRKLV
ncbi:ABC-ATPase domain-containing protein [Streptoalloteichus hindustanus]|uniref:ABC-ATPase domain-containing protein n=1 Tax=Streptoalloteichus hindustanus TaxID=2017 RepID=UPI002E0E5CE0